MSKDLFMEQRMYESMLSEKVTKKSVEAKIKEVANEIENGNLDPKVTLIQAKIMKDYADGVYEAARSKVNDLDVSDLPQNLSGVEISERNGYETIDYEADTIYANLKQRLKEREGLLKSVYQHSQKLAKVEIVDADGVLVPCVPVKSFVKSSLIVKY
jgi:23S rRNA U2552 (ribose-2'-O)-methylase RlmE/FtsJ